MTSELTTNSRDLPPPIERSTIIGWAYKNLFSTWFNTLLTIFALGIIYALLKPILTWLVEQADFEVVNVNLRLLLTGQYPREELWRVWLCLDLLAINIGLAWGIWIKRRVVLGLLLIAAPLALALLPTASAPARRDLLILAVLAMLAFGVGKLGGKSLRRMAISAWVLYFPLVIILIRGVTPPEGWLPATNTNLWGGLLLTFLLTIVGILFSFPFGVLLALGRRSQLPAIRWVSITYIEVIRGVPLVTILFMSSTMVPLFLPSGSRPDLVLRAMVGITLFSAAYLAENVRGGLQAVSHGQYEAAHALGLSGFKTMVFIVLPQALRIIIPVLVGLFIALFKDTSLVATIGLLELLGISRSVLAQPQFVSFQREVYLFISFIYWSLSYLMSYVSQRLEVALGVGVR